jgi:hypothetical protein
LAGPLQAQEGQPFDPGCTSLPFIALHHPIDDDCGVEGKLADPAKQQESRAKNDFCSTGTPTWVTFYTFKKLKQKPPSSPEGIPYWPPEWSKGKSGAIWEQSRPRPAVTRTEIGLP